MSVTHTLKNPITYTMRGQSGDREVTITEVTLREPKAGDMRAIDGETGSVSRTCALIAQLSEMMPRHVDELSILDFTILGGIIGDFLPDGLPTGETP